MFLLETIIEYGILSTANTKGSIFMNSRDITKSLTDQSAEANLTHGAPLHENTPNEETQKAMAELESGGGHRYTGTTEQLFKELMES
jgi:hypothetical protein